MIHSKSHIKNNFSPFYRERSFRFFPLITSAWSEADRVTDLKTRYNRKMNVMRFLAMGSIVWGHCVFVDSPGVVLSPNTDFIQSLIRQLGRVGTVNFFLISGFFLGDKVMSYSLKGYLNGRFKTIILPWLYFVVIFTVAELLYTNAFQQR